MDITEEQISEICDHYCKFNTYFNAIVKENPDKNLEDLLEAFCVDCPLTEVMSK